MSKLDSLITELCPDGVEYRALENATLIELGKRVTKAEIERNLGNYPVWHGGEIPMGYINKTNCLPNTVLVANTGSIGYVNWIGTNSWCSDAASMIKAKNDILHSRFLYHFLKSKEFKLKKYRRIGGVPTLELRKLKSFPIPLPPLPVQKEIVRILDNFTELTIKLQEELNKELTARKKQYEYYRDELLTFGDEVEWKLMGESLKRTKGTKITAKRMKQLHSDNGEIRIFAGGKTYADVHYGDIPEKDINTDPSIIVKSRGMIEFEYFDKPFSHKNEFWSYYSEDENIDIKFIYYFLQTKINYFQHRANVMQMPQISIPVTEKYKIPIPPLSEQERIVSILDKFDALVNDISIGLPAEIEARQKQYEYYREKLLTFKELDRKEV